MVQKFSGVKVKLWHWFEEEIGNQNGPFEINQSRMAEKFDVSRKSIQNALKTFQSANLLEKVESRTGRGVHSLYKLIWTFKKKNKKSATPNSIYSNPKNKSLTKGRQWRYFAYKFRTLVEDSSLASRAQTIVGKILNFLENKPPDLAHRWLKRLKHWLHGPPVKKTIKDFFVFFHVGLMEIARSQMELEQTEQRIEEQQKQRKEVEVEYENNPPPKSSDFARFSDYLEAMEEWES
ncbi:HTH domain-containing protein [Candidatus Bipolaricaulota bacterium]|nr:HTH domain-containing protein [Candidatus Bipolaricaulota bacterium]